MADNPDFKKLISVVGGMVKSFTQKGAADAKSNKSFLTKVGDGFKEGYANTKAMVSGSSAKGNREQFMQTSKVVLSEFGDQAMFQARRLLSEIKGDDEEDGEEKKKSSWWKIIKDIFMKFLAPLIMAAAAGASVLLGLFGDGPLQGAGQVLARVFTSGGVWKIFTKILPSRLGEWFTKLFSSTIDDLFRVLTSQTGIIGKHIITPLANLFPKLAAAASNLFAGIAPGLKVIPFIGPLISFGFAAWDLSKGDFLGAVINLLAGITGFAPPPLNFILPLGLSVFNLFLDMKMGTEGKKDWGKKHMGFLGMLAKGALYVGKMLSKLLPFLPFIGSILDFGFAYKRFKGGDFVGGMIDLAAGIAGLVPGVGTAISIGLSLINEILDNTGGGQKVKGFLGGGGTGIFKMIISQGLKWGAKLAKVLKFIPVIGGFVSIGFAIHRFKKGQYIRGVLELVAGIADLVGPITMGGGTVVSWALDGILIAMDLIEMALPKKTGVGGKKSIDWGAIGSWIYKSILSSGWMFPFHMLALGIEGLVNGAPLGETLGKMAYAIPGMGWIAGLVGAPKTYEEYEKTGASNLSFMDIAMQIPLLNNAIYAGTGIFELFSGNLSEGLKNLAYAIPAVKPLYDLFNTEENQSAAQQLGVSPAKMMAIAMGRKVIGWIPTGFKTIVAKAMGATMGVSHTLLTMSDDEFLAESVGGSAADALEDANDKLTRGSKAISDRAGDIEKAGKDFTKGSPYADELLGEAGRSINVRVKKLAGTADVTLGDVFANVIRSFGGLGDKANKALESDIKSRTPRSDLVSLSQQQLKVQQSVASDLRTLVDHIVHKRDRAQFSSIGDIKHEESAKELDMKIEDNLREGRNVERERMEADDTEHKRQKGFWGNVQDLAKTIANPNITVKTKVDMGGEMNDLVSVQREVHGALTRIDAPIIQALRNINTSINTRGNGGGTTVIPVGTTQKGGGITSGAETVASKTRSDQRND